MGNTTRRVRAAFVALFLSVTGACADSPADVDRPPVVRSFLPENQRLDAFLGDTIRFSLLAVDPDRGRLHQRFLIGDSVVAVGDVWRYVVADTGDMLVKCIVTDGTYVSRVLWDVERHLPETTIPVITRTRPADDAPVMIVGTDLEFAIRVEDQDGDSLSYEFAVDDSVTSYAANFVYTPVTIGDRVVRASASDGEHVVGHLWALKVTGIPDTIAPARVGIQAFETGTNPGELELRWTAVGQDGMDGIASEYLVRTSPSPIVDDVAWARGSQRQGVPAPRAPGMDMSMTVDGMIPARYTYVAVRAVDDFGNLSALGPPVGNYARGMRIVGTVYDAMFGDPIGGIAVQVGHYRTQTTPAGHFEFIELPPITGELRLRDEPDSSVIGSYYDFVMPYSVAHLDSFEIFLIPNRAMVSNAYPDFLDFFVQMTRIAGIPYPNEQRRWEAPIDIHAPAFVKDGLDYAAAVYAASDDVDVTVGLDLLRRADAPPSLGVVCRYLDGLMYDNYFVDRWSSDYYPLNARIEFRTGYSSASAIAYRRVAIHEIGHALGLNHSVDSAHMMIAGQTPAVDMFSDDEIAVIRVRYRIPRGLRISYTIRD